MLGFLAIGCPFLSWKLWWIKDGFGIRNELLMNMIIGLPGFILYFISPFYLKKLDAGHWNHVNWLILTIFLSHVNSVVLPLIQFFMRQRPKKRASSTKGSTGIPFASILRWDSPKKSSGAATMDVCSETSSFRFDSCASSQIASPHHGTDLCDSSVYDGQSIAPSIRSQSPVGDDPLSSRAHHTSASGQRLRGLKGFWAKYGKDANGNDIPLSQMNPRAFEYTLQDGEMMNELVKFSVTVFSAENTKFLQEYDGLRKQVREYFKLVGYGNPRPRGQKHNRNASNLTESALGTGPEGDMHESDLSTRTRRKVSSLLGGIATSFHSRRSPQGSTTGGSDRASQSGSIIDSIVEECHSVHDGEPGSSACHQPCAVHTGRSFRKPRQELKGNLWKLSLQSSFRHSNPAFVSPYGPLQEEEDTDESLEGGQTRSDPLPLPHDRTPFEQRHLRKLSYGGQIHNEMGTNSMDGANESKHGSGGNESDGSSFSWYGRGNTGSALSYREVTPSDISSSQDTTSDGIQYPSEFYSDSYSIEEIPPRAEIGDITIHDPLRETFDGACPIHIPSGKPLTSSESREVTPCSKNTARSPRSSRRYTSYSESSPIGSLDRAREAMTPIAQQKQPSRFAMGQKSPFHSPSSSVSATFTPRLPLQPQLHGANTFRSHPPSFRRSMSARSITTMLTTEEIGQLNAARAGTSNPPSMPLSQPQCELPAPHTQVDSGPEKESRRQQLQSSDMSSIHSHHSSVYARSPPMSSRYRPATTSQTSGQAAFPTPNQRTPIPRALLPAYWEICRTFIMPNATLELNLDEEHVGYIKRLFKNNECYLEMYEPIVREVQELVYSNVWPRFVQSIQRQPQGLSEKFLKTWHGLFGGSSRSRGDEEMCTGHATTSTTFGVRGWRHSGRRQQQHHLGSTSRDRLQQQPTECMLMERGFAKATSSVSPSPPPQPSYVHGFLGGAGDRSTRGGEKGEDMEMDVGQFGVMQELDFTVLQRIVVHPK